MLAEFDYELPEAAIAQQPLEPRDSARLLVALAGAGVEHRHVGDLPEYLRPGDVVVVNESRVLPSRLALRKPSGGAVEVLLLEARAEPNGATFAPGSDPFVPGAAWEALVRPSRKVAAGTDLYLAGEGETAGDRVAVTVGADLGEGRREVTIVSPAAVRAAGTLPLPPYITAAVTEPQRYQTVFARVDGSAAAPTAGLHFTDELLARCEAVGAAVHRVELHVGLDTFRPVTVADPADHHMHSERYFVPDSTWAAVQSARGSGGRVLAIGTTSVRALEAAAATGEMNGRTKLFVRRPYEFQVVDLLLTNFHMPRTTLLMMIDAFVGPRWRDLYGEALTRGYRFLSFGDAMLLARGV